LIVLKFFFSSRRRHTRFSRDWSSDVCSSDLGMATNDGSPLVRLYLNSAVQRIGPESRWEIVAGLISHYGDVNDHNLPLMNWYAFEPLIDLDMERAMQMAVDAEQPTILQFTIRKLGMMDSDEARQVLKTAQQNIEDKFTAEKNHEIREELSLLMDNVQ